MCVCRAQTDAVRVSLFQTAADAISLECRDLWLKLECAPCDPRLGVVAAMRVCTPFCDALYDTCRGGWFAGDQRSMELRPCQEGKC